MVMAGDGSDGCGGGGVGGDGGRRGEAVTVAEAEAATAGE